MQSVTRLEQDAEHMAPKIALQRRASCECGWGTAPCRPRPSISARLQNVQKCLPPSRSTAVHSAECTEVSPALAEYSCTLLQNVQKCLPPSRSDASDTAPVEWAIWSCQSAGLHKVLSLSLSLCSPHAAVVRRSCLSPFPVSRQNLEPGRGRPRPCLGALV